ILAREMGSAIELDEVQVESLVAQDLRSGPVEEFLERLGQFDQDFAGRLQSAGERDRVLRYAGVIDEQGRVSAGLREYPSDHPFPSLKGRENIVSFQPSRYHTQPMIVRGPGAGPEVTAAGVFADLLRLASFLGAPQ